MITGWNDVNEKMPTIDKKYGQRLWCYWLNYRDGKRNYYSMGELIYKSGKFYSKYVGGHECAVTHWMELPPKPKIKKPLPSPPNTTP